VLSGIEAILFDMGGTLIDYPVPNWPTAIGKCLEGVYGFIVRPETASPAVPVPGHEETHVRRDPLPPDAPAPHRAMMGLRRVVRSVSGRTLPRMAEACARMIVADGRIFPDTLPALRGLEARGYPMGIVSNTPWGTPEYFWENQLDRFGLGRHFAVACFSSGVGFRKPDSRIFRIALDRLGADPARTLFVGDELEADIVGASQAGMRTALVKRYARSRTGQPRPPVDPRATLQIASLAELLLHLPDRRS
jgi:FMN phosphatase YigB (HAD superfamily)